MREKIKNILSNSYTKQGEFDEYKALNELCVLLDVSEILNQLTEMSNESNERSVRNTGELEAFLQGKVEAYTMAIDIITNASSR